MKLESTTAKVNELVIIRNKKYSIELLPSGPQLIQFAGHGKVKLPDATMAMAHRFEVNDILNIDGDDYMIWQKRSTFNTFIYMTRIGE